MRSQAHSNCFAAEIPSLKIMDYLRCPTKGRVTTYYSVFSSIWSAPRLNKLGPDIYVFLNLLGQT
jgi:hypothetical protein